MRQGGFEWGESESPCLKVWPPAIDNIQPQWRDLVASFMASSPGQSLVARVQQVLDRGVTVYPPEPFRALQLTALSDVRVVILGQDPYHGPGQAEGLAFSVPPGVKTPPSLRNVFKELQRSLGVSMPVDGSLVRWAQQGVLLLNTCLTVEEGRPASHARWGWEVLTDQIVGLVARQAGPVVFLFWGAHAQARAALISQAAPDGRHLVLQANHPSPLAALRPPRPFIGSNHFLMTQEFLLEHGLKPVNW